MTPKLQHKGTYQLNKNRLTDIENKVVVPKGEGGREGRTESVGLTDTIMKRMGRQQGPTVEHRELYSLSCDKP